MCAISLPAVTQPIEYSCTMHRTAKVSTVDYIPGEPVRERDDYGIITFSEPDDFSSTDWMGEYKNQHLTPIQLMAILERKARELADGNVPAQVSRYWRNIADECQGWMLDDEDAGL